jgi:HSP20 family molecular chaperone IbpA
MSHTWEAADELFAKMLGSIPHLAGFSGGHGIDIVEEKGKLNVYADVPGVSEQNIKVMADTDQLSIHYQKPCLVDELAEKYKNQEDFTLWRQSRNCGTYATSFYLPTQIRVNSVEAKVKDGVLHISADKADGKSGHREIPIQRF